MCRNNVTEKHVFPIRFRYYNLALLLKIHNDVIFLYICNETEIAVVYRFDGIIFIETAALLNRTRNWALMVFAVDYAVAESYRVILIFICRQLNARQMLVGVNEFLHVVVERETRHRAAQLHRDNADYIVR